MANRPIVLALATKPGQHYQMEHRPGGLVVLDSNSAPVMLTDTNGNTHKTFSPSQLIMLTGSGKDVRISGPGFDGNQPRIFLSTSEPVTVVDQSGISPDLQRLHVLGEKDLNQHQAAVVQAFKGHKEAPVKSAMDIAKERLGGKDGIVSGAEASAFSESVKRDVMKAMIPFKAAGKDDAIKRLQQLDVVPDGRFDEKDVEKLKTLVPGNYDKTHLDRITEELGDKTVSIKKPPTQEQINEMIGRGVPNHLIHAAIEQAEQLKQQGTGGAQKTDANSVTPPPLPGTGGARTPD